jgi:integrase
LRFLAEFGRIQDAAGIHLECRETHEHTDSCHRYGFHDLRRAFATANAETLTASVLQALMRHKSFTTTQRYVNMAKQLNRSVEGLAFPDILKRKAN